MKGLSFADGYFPWAVPTLAEDGKPFRPWDGSTYYGSGGGSGSGGGQNPLVSASSELMVSTFGPGGSHPVGPMTVEEATEVYWRFYDWQVSSPAVAVLWTPQHQYFQQDLSAVVDIEGKTSPASTSLTLSTRRPFSPGGDLPMPLIQDPQRRYWFHYGIIFNQLSIRNGTTVQRQTTQGTYPYPESADYFLVDDSGRAFFRPDPPDGSPRPRSWDFYTRTYSGGGTGSLDLTFHLARKSLSCVLTTTLEWVHSETVDRANWTPPASSPDPSWITPVTGGLTFQPTWLDYGGLFDPSTGLPR